MIVCAGGADGMDVAMNEPNRQKAEKEGQRDAESAKGADHEQHTAEGGEPPHRHGRGRED